VQQLFLRASANAHEKLVNVLEDKTGFGISTGNGVVTLDVHQMSSRSAPSSASRRMRSRSCRRRPAPSRS